MSETVVLPNTTPSAPSNPGASTFNDPDAYNALDSLAGDDGAPEKPEAPTAPAAPEPKARDDSGKFTKPAEKAPEKPVEKPKVPAKSPEKAPEKAQDESEDFDVEKVAPKPLREAYVRLKAKHAALEKEHTEFKSKASKPADDPEKKTLTERLAEREKRIADYEEKLRFTDYSQSDEYKEKYQTPFEDAYLSGRARMSALKTVEQKNPDTGEVTRASRQGTAEDFDELMKIADDDRAADWAVEHFGNKASLALFHRERVQELNGARKKAIDEYRKNGSEREKQRSEQLTKFQQDFDAAIEAANTAAAEKYPQWFKPDDADAKGNELLEAGKHLVARVAANGKALKDGDKPMSHQDLARAVSAIRNKAAAFDRLAYRYAASTKQVKELEAELAEYKKSEPGPGEAKRLKVGQTEGSESPQEAFDMSFKDL